MKHFKKRTCTNALTVSGNASMVQQGSEAYQRMLDIAAQADAYEGIRQGLEDERNGRRRPIREFFAEFERTHQIPAYHA